MHFKTLKHLFLFRHRSGAMRTCILMVLLCAMWSCAIMWLSRVETKVMACLFCILSILYALASLIFYCLIPLEVRQIYAKCLSRFKKHENHNHHASRRHLMSGTLDTRDATMVPNGFQIVSHSPRSDGGYPNTTTSVVPMSRAKTMSLATKSTCGRMDPLMPNSSGSLPHNLIRPCAHGCCRTALHSMGACRNQMQDPDAQPGTFILFLLLLEARIPLCHFAFHCVMKFDKNYKFSCIKIK